MYEDFTGCLVFDDEWSYFIVRLRAAGWERGERSLRATVRPTPPIPATAEKKYYVMSQENQRLIEPS